MNSIIVLFVEYCDATMLFNYSQIILTFGPFMQNLLYDTFFLPPNRNEGKRKTVMILSHIRKCYLLRRLFHSHYMLRSDILFFPFLLPAAIVIFVREQRTEHDSNCTYVTLLLFSHILAKMHKTLLHIKL